MSLYHQLPRNNGWPSTPRADLARQKIGDLIKGAGNSNSSSLNRVACRLLSSVLAGDWIYQSNLVVQGCALDAVLTMLRLISQGSWWIRL